MSTTASTKRPTPVLIATRSPPPLLPPTPPHHRPRPRLLPLLRRDAACETATPERGVMTGTLTAPLGVSTTIAIARLRLHLRLVRGIIISGGGLVPVLHLPIETEEVVHILLPIDDHHRSRRTREGETMGMMGGEGVLEEDMAQGTEGDLLIRFIHLKLKLLCD